MKREVFKRHIDSEGSRPLSVDTLFRTESSKVFSKQKQTNKHGRLIESCWVISHLLLSSLLSLGVY